MKRALIVGLMVCPALFMNACATFKKPAATNEAPVRERAMIKEGRGILASAAVVGDEEARQIFGINLARKKIQAVWLKIENNTDEQLLLLPTAIDPDYYAPLEVSFAYHRFFAGDANAALDQHLLDLNFPTRSLIMPGSKASGYIFTTWSSGLKVVDIDLMGDDLSHNFTFFLPGPGAEQGLAIIKHMEAMFPAAIMQNVEDEAALRKILEQLPCCVSSEQSAPPAEPLNLVIIGRIDDWVTAFSRRGYRLYGLNARYAFGRAQDLAGKKLSWGYARAHEQFIRLWQSPIRYQGRPVWVGQTSTRLGGRFADKASAKVTLPLDPYVDESRDDITQEMAYSQVLKKIGYVKGAGRHQPEPADLSSKDLYYKTDGLRVVMVFGDRPVSLAAIKFFAWERLLDYR